METTLEPVDPNQSRVSNLAYASLLPGRRMFPPVFVDNKEKMEGSMKLQLILREDPDLLATNAWIITDIKNGAKSERAVAEPVKLVFKLLPPQCAVAPTIQFIDFTLPELCAAFEAAVEGAGHRIPRKEEERDVLIATRYHLEDLRSLLFNKKRVTLEDLKQKEEDNK
jgi:hypothetical protein